MSSSTRTLHFPSQKISRAKKTEKWAKECIEAGEDLAIFRNTGIRESYRNKLVNYNLANDILDTQDIESVCNPMGIKNANFPATMQNYPVINPKFDLLIGEERKRKFDWHVRVMNDDAISDKENAKKSQIFQFIQEKVAAKQLDEEQTKQELNKLNKYLNYEWQDIHERTATMVLSYLYKHLDLKDTFSRGFEDALIAGEEIYCGDIVGGEPVLRKVNPLNIHTVRSGESPWIQDADIIVEDGYYSPGQVIDMFYDWLTDKQIKLIDQGTASDDSDEFITIGEREQSILIDGIVDDTTSMTKPYGEYYDTEGNMRVTRVLWRSMKKVGKLTYYDQDGQRQETLVSETYKVNKEVGEEIEWLWVGEWWEGTRIGKDIYTKIQARPVQFRSMTNLAKCGSGYVGLAYNINSSRAKSLMDRLKPYQYLYNIFMYRTELAFAKAKGRIATLDLAQVPDNWDLDKWMYYAEVNGWAVKDSFKEARKGAAQGKLAGQMATSADTINLELGNYIQQHIMMLQFIENQIGEISGVSKQRQGQIENRELVGNVERSVTQSSHITEKWFSLHSTVKVKALEVLLETAKFAWKGEKDKRVQYVLDDMSTSMLNLQGEQFNSCEYGIHITDGSADAELLNSMKQLAHAGIQNDKLNFSQLMDIYLTPSMASMRRKLENAEREKEQQMQEQQAQAQQMQQEQLQAQAQENQAQREFEINKINLEYDRKAEIEAMKIQGKFGEKVVDMDRDGIPDEIEVEKLRLEDNIKKEDIATKERIEKAKLEHAASEGDKDRKNKIELEKLKAKNKPSPVNK
jgi:hypothetical protein